MHVTQHNLTYFLIGGLTLIVVAVAIVIISQQQEDTSTEEKAPQEQETTSTQQGNNLDIQLPSKPIEQLDDVTAGGVITGPDTPQLHNPQYLAYNETTFERFFAENRQIVLFFHASWCPTCKVLDEDITERLNELPSDTAILKVDYDSYPDLKREYNITYQHTLIFIKQDVGDIHREAGATFEALKRVLSSTP